IVMNGGTLTIAGPIGTAVAAGAGGGVHTPTSAITGSGGTVTADPRVALQPAFGAPPVAVGHTLTTVPLPSVSADVSAPMQQLTVDLVAMAGDLAQIYVSLPFGPIPAPPPIQGDIRVNLGAAVVLGAFAIPASEHTSLAFPFSPDPALLGLPLTFQAIVL